MGIDILLEDADRKPIQECHDADQSFAHFFRGRDLSATSCLRFIDAFGDTVFNRAQASVLVDELSAVRAEASAGAQRYIDNAIRLAKIASRKVHLFVRFVGD
jgi:hypothetical protein